MYHHRRKSGHGYANTSMTDVRKATIATDSKHKRPSMTRRHTPGSAQKLGRSHRERDYYESWEDERESFPQFCTTCEKQFVPSEEKHLYCSETCRRIDQDSSAHTSQVRTYSVSSKHAYYSMSQEPRDIIPRASPSRPSSMHFSHSPPASPDRTSGSHPSVALSALRSLTIGPPSPPSPTGSNGSSIWPFGRSAATSPPSSYRRPGANTAPSYDLGNHYYKYGSGAYTYDSGADRPLPARYPGAYSRPKSTELVTPVLGR